MHLLAKGHSDSRLRGSAFRPLGLRRRISRTLSRSLLVEAGIYSGIGFTAFVSILLTLNFAQELEDLIAVGFTRADAWSLVGFILPITIGYAIPVGLLFGILVALGRLSSDLEILAMDACGIGMTGVAMPLLLLALGLSIVTAYLMIQVEPQSRLGLRRLLSEIAARGGVVEAGRFRDVAGRLVFCDARDAHGNLRGVVISDATDPSHPFVALSERGHLRFDPNLSAIRLTLESGDILLGEGRSNADRGPRVSFERFEYAFDAKPLLDIERWIRPRDLAMGELIERLHLARHDSLPVEIRRRNRHEYEVQVHRRLALPLTPLLFAALGVPLGLGRSRSSRSRGVWTCVAVVGLYYMGINVAEELATEGRVAASLAVWLPNLVCVAGTIILAMRSRRVEA